MKLIQYVKTSIRQQLKSKQKITEDIFSVDNSIKKHEKYIIEAVINFLKDEWDFNAKITVKKKQSNTLFGDVVLNTNSVVNNKFTLHFNPNQSYLEMIRSLIHELTHVKQISSGQLKPGANWKSLIWKNDYEISVSDYKKCMKDFNKYKKLPWEAEAYDNMANTTLRQKLFTSRHWTDLYGIDDTLDFIIDNL